MKSSVQAASQQATVVADAISKLKSHREEGDDETDAASPTKPVTEKKKEL